MIYTNVILPRHNGKLTHDTPTSAYHVISARAENRADSTGHLSFATLTHFVNDEGHGPAMAIFFTTRAWAGTPRICEPHKCDSLGLFDFDDLPHSIVPYVANALADIQDKLLGRALRTGFSVFGWTNPHAWTGPGGPATPA